MSQASYPMALIHKVADLEQRVARLEAFVLAHDTELREHFRGGRPVPPAQPPPLGSVSSGDPESEGG